jgi:NNP family nitrate/nitrite transporter-like MFS transporter
MPEVEKDLGMGHAEAGSLFLMTSLGYFITITTSGFFSARLNHRRTIILSAATLGLALMGTSLSSGAWGLRIGLLLLGMAAGLYLPSGIATLTASVKTRHWGKAIAIHELAPNLSFMTAPLISEALMMWFSWRTVLMLLGLASIAAGFAFARFGRVEDFPGEAPGFRALKTLFSEPSFWIMIALFSLGIAGTLGVYAMLPLFLVTQYGLDRNWANTLVALSRIPSPAMAFLAGWASDRLGTARTMRIVFLITGVITILMGIATRSWIVPLVFLQPVMAVCFFPPAFAALSSIGTQNTRSLAVALTVPFGFLLGGGAIPAAIGMTGEAGSFSSGIVLVGGLILAGFFLALRLNDRGKK